jgi:cysteine-rich repeat protein
MLRTLFVSVLLLFSVSAMAKWCGDGNVDQGQTSTPYEECDDGNNMDGDGCSAICLIEVTEPYCGDGILDEGEQCDDGNNDDGDGCSAECTFEPYSDGCTPGYWKQNQHSDSWTTPYEPTTQFSSVFDDAFPGMTLLQVVKKGGGGLKALGRHTVAALLNAASGDVTYGIDVAGVISQFNDAYASGEYNSVKDGFEVLNELGCPIN